MYIYIYILELILSLLFQTTVTDNIEIRSAIHEHLHYLYLGCIFYSHLQVT